MRQLKDGYRGMQVLFEINIDLMLFVAAIVLALAAVSYLSTL